VFNFSTNFEKTSTKLPEVSRDIDSFEIHSIAILSAIDASSGM